MTAPGTVEEWATRRQRALDQLDLYASILPGLLQSCHDANERGRRRVALIGVTSAEWDEMDCVRRCAALDEVWRCYDDRGRRRRKPRAVAS